MQFYIRCQVRTRQYLACFAKIQSTDCDPDIGVDFSQFIPQAFSQSPDSELGGTVHRTAVMGYHSVATDTA